jgi:hypothetical protein
MILGGGGHLLNPIQPGVIFYEWKDQRSSKIGNPKVKKLRLP